MNPTCSTGSRRERIGRTRPGGPGVPAGDPVSAPIVAEALTAPLPSPRPGPETLVATTVPAAASAGMRERIALTVRIDCAMHARLRALAARQQRTCQDIVEGALDAYLNVFSARCACRGSESPST